MPASFTSQISAAFAAALSLWVKSSRCPPFPDSSLHRPHMGAAPMCTPLRPRGCTPHTRRRDRLQPCIPPRHTRCTQSRRSAHSPGPPCLPQSPALAALMLGQHAWAAGREQAAQPAASSLPSCPSPWKPAPYRARRRTPRRARRRAIAARTATLAATTL